MNEFVTNYDVPLNNADAYLTLPTKSAQIRYLAEQGLTRYQIAKKLNIRYQHVRNVLISPPKKA
jgi:DNA-binding NarL/FixJ family response regulator